MLPSVLPRLATDSAVSVSWCLETSLFLRLPSRVGAHSLPLLSLFLSFIFFPISFQRQWAAFLGCLMSSAGIQKLFCGIYSALKCSFDEFVGDKVVSPSYSSTILGPPPIFFNWSVIALQNLLFFVKPIWISHRYAYIPSLLSLPPSPSPSHSSRLIQNPCLSFLRHTANSHWLSIYIW